MRRLLPLLVLSLTACPRPQPLPRIKIAMIPQRPMKVPPGCLANFAGLWEHADDPSWQYAARDDGGTLELDAFRTFQGGMPDAGEGVPPAPAARIRLERMPDGFYGEAVADVLHPTGRICQAKYPTTIQSCSDGGLVLLAAAAVSLGDGCQTPLPPRTPVMLEHRLVRADAGLPAQETTP
jgi:hypothetical protein